MLGDAQIAQLGFIYRDGTESKEVEKPTLMTVLSMGERRALYILNVIFEIQRRKKDGQETLFVIDDIADSFDYRNKYAIIQYLNETSMESIFKLVIMTHNFDFFRTLNSRFVAYRNCLMASKNSEGITLTQASDIRNPFANDWRGRFFTHERKQIASICFLRNIIEMTKGETDPKFMKLTSMLHWKPDSADLTVGELDKIFTELCGVAGKSKDPSRKVCELILEEAKICLRETSGLNLENKIVLAMAIRLAAEKFIIAQIRDDAYVASIQSNQTHNLIEKYKAKFPGQIDTIMIFDKVALMTPENIHVNAFMYEPIVDTPDDHLKKLYAEVTSLK